MHTSPLGRLLLSPLCRAEGDPLPPSVGDAPDPAPVARARQPERANCEFCECQLTARGEVLKFSDRAKKFRTQNETIERLERELTEARADAQRLKDEVAQLKTSPASRPSARGGVAVVG